MKKSYKHGRGAQFNPPSRFEEYTPDESTFNDNNQDWETDESAVKTKFYETHAKTILNKVTSPDIGLSWSMNPYQGCEHGCVYCYARNTHPFWGFSAGTDFESKILIKRNAPELLRKKLGSKNWISEPIMFSGNTDCYQPIERQTEITRNLLKVLWEFRHPVGLITKNSLILRDIDILEKMARHNLVKVTLSINGQDEDLRRRLEPRTASFKKRVEVIKKLSERDIPVNVLIAPIIPGLNDHEIFDTVKAVAEAGAKTAHHIVIRLNGDVRAIFEDWIEKNYPNRAAKVIHKIAALHGGKTNDSRFGVRMKGEGNYAEIIADQMDLARRRFMTGRSVPKFNTELYNQMKNGQLKLF